MDNGGQGVEHCLVAGLVEIKLDADFTSLLYIRKCVRRGQYYDHSVVLYVTDDGREVQVFGVSASVCREEADRTAIFEIVFGLFILQPFDFYDELVQGIIVTLSWYDRIPAQSLLDAAVYSGPFDLLAVHLFFIFEFFLQKIVLMLQVCGRSLELSCHHSLFNRAQTYIKKRNRIGVFLLSDVIKSNEWLSLFVNWKG